MLELRADLAGARDGYRVTLDPRRWPPATSCWCTSTALLNRSLDGVLAHAAAAPRRSPWSAPAPAACPTRCSATRRHRRWPAPGSPTPPACATRCAGPPLDRLRAQVRAAPQRLPRPRRAAGRGDGGMRAGATPPARCCAHTCRRSKPACWSATPRCACCCWRRWPASMCC